MSACPRRDQSVELTCGCLDGSVNKAVFETNNKITGCWCTLCVLLTGGYGDNYGSGGGGGWNQGGGGGWNQGGGGGGWNQGGGSGYGDGYGNQG